MKTLFTVTEVARILRLHPVTVRNLMYKGVIPYCKVGRSVRVKESDLEKILRKGGEHESKRTECA
jgi:excisionase family DNA binding protein